MNNPSLRFSILLTLILGVTFVAHAFVQDALLIGSFERHIVLNYCFNFFLTIAFFTTLIYFKKRRSHQLGFVFLFSSMLKFSLFFALIYPDFKETPGVRSAEFASFIIPYGISVATETIYLVRTLNSEV